MSEILQIPVHEGTDEASHLTVRLDVSEGESRGAVLYMHGFGSSQGGSKANFFRERFTAHGFAFCSFDFQGHGESDGGMLGLSLSRNLADARRVQEALRERGFEKVILVGSSMGGLTGLWYAARFPEEVMAGLFLAPAIDLGRTMAERVGEKGMRQWRRTGRLRVSDDLVDCELGWGFAEDFERYDRARLEQEYRCPTLILQGKNDDSVSWRAVSDFATGCRYEGIELHLFADGDHRLLEHRPRLWRLMMEFFAGRGLNGAEARATSG